MSAQAERLDLWSRFGAPALVCMLATVLFAAPIRVFGLQLPQPVFPLVPAFAWAVLRPSLVAPFALLMLGLFLDLVWGGRIGLWAAALIGAYVTVLVTRSMITGQDRTLIWAWFALACAVAEAIGYGATLLDAGAPPSLVSTFWQLAPTALLYPFASRMIDRFEDADVRYR
jgi:rod shape-determining protein MreD